MRLWRLAHPGANAVRAKQWRQAGNRSTRPEGYLEQQRLRAHESYHTNPEYRERTKEHARRKRKEQPALVKAALATWQEKNRGHMREYQAAYQRNRRATDPEYRQRALTSQTMWRLRHWAKDSHSDSWTRQRENKAIDPAHLRKLRGWQGGRCYLCNQISSDLWIEHLVPRARGGGVLDPQNIVYACPACQTSRQDKFFHLEWRPKVIEPDESGSLLRYTVLSQALTEAGLGGSLDSSGAFVLDTAARDSRPLFVVSTFAGSERNPGAQGGRIACRLQAQNPSAIVLFDHEWYGRREAILNMLRSKMGIAIRGPGARELSIVDVDPERARKFLGAHHAMGSVDAAYRIGLTDGTDLFGLGVFADREDSYECVRLAFKGHVAGGMSRIMQAVGRLHGTRSISTYIDTRYATGDGHEGVGFQLRGRTPETYQWVFPNRMQHQRYLSNDNKMSSNLLLFNPEASREDNFRANGVFRIWIPGRIRMVWKP